MSWRRNVTTCRTYAISWLAVFNFHNTNVYVTTVAATIAAFYSSSFLHLTQQPEGKVIHVTWICGLTLPYFKPDAYINSP